MTPAAACSGATAGSTWTKTAFFTCWRRTAAWSSATTPAASRLEDVKLAFTDDLKPTDKNYLWGICVSNGELLLHRSHPTEMFQCYSLKTGAKMNVVEMPKDFYAIARAPKSNDEGTIIKPVKSDVGAPVGRKTLRVLFIGNSQFRCVSDIPEIIEEMTRATTDKNVPVHPGRRDRCRRRRYQGVLG